MADATKISRYPIAEKVGLSVQTLEDEVNYYKKLANLRFPNIEASDLSANMAQLLAENDELKRRLAQANQHEAYQKWFESAFGKAMPVPNTWPFSTFQQGTPWCDKVVYGMQDGEILYAEHLLGILEKDGIKGDIVEFGTYFGHWVQVICETLERNQWSRNVWGFDSFEGLPEPDAKLDPDCWTKGMYSAPFEEVQKRLQIDKRLYLKLVKGWFNKTLIEEPATSIQKIAYARIDGDLYESCFDCLKYLDGRLVDGAVVVFDDWQFSTDIGEPKAVKEWLDAGAASRYRFEYLEMNMWAHLYARVWHR